MNDDSEAMKQRLMLYALVLMGVVFFGGSIIYLAITMGSRSGQQTVHWPVQAEAYVWPAGCEQKEYRQMDVISYNCADKKYYLDGHGDYHFHRGSRGNDYFRVGNDAIDIRCSDYSHSDCNAYGIYKNVFFQNVRRHNIWLKAGMLGSEGFGLILV